MKDRVPTQVLENGAVRMEQFDASGNSLGYLWLKRADAPIEEGTPLCKSTLLAADAVAAVPGLRAFINPTVSDALRNLGKTKIALLFDGDIAAGETKNIDAGAIISQYVAFVMGVESCTATLSVGVPATNIATVTAYLGYRVVLCAGNGFLRIPRVADEYPVFEPFTLLGTSLVQDLTLTCSPKAGGHVIVYGIYRGDGDAE